MNRFAVLASCAALAACNQTGSPLATPAGALFCVLQKPGITVIANVVNTKVKDPTGAALLVLAENATATAVQTACDKAAAAAGYSGGAPTAPPAGGSTVPPVAIP